MGGQSDFRRKEIIRLETRFVWGKKNQYFEDLKKKKKIGKSSAEKVLAFGNPSAEWIKDVAVNPFNYSSF